MFGFGTMEVAIVVGVVVLLFGIPRLPQLARSLGAALPEFKKGMTHGAIEDTEPTRQRVPHDDNS